jgi:hypothetical protein
VVEVVEEIEEIEVIDEGSSITSISSTTSTTSDSLWRNHQLHHVTISDDDLLAHGRAAAADGIGEESQHAGALDQHAGNWKELGGEGVDEAEPAPLAAANDVNGHVEHAAILDAHEGLGPLRGWGGAARRATARSAQQDDQPRGERETSGGWCVMHVSLLEEGAPA